MICKKHGELYIKPIGKGSNRRSRCSKCMVERVTKCRQGLKKRLVAHFGGKCARCGYNKCTAALEFHHKDKTVKEFAVGSGETTKSYARILVEAEKCDLVCANCHRELHTE